MTAEAPAPRRGFARLLPSSATPDASRLVVSRALRGLADGFVSVMLASYLVGNGYTPFEISVIVTGTLLGSAFLTLGVGLLGHRLTRRRLLFASAGLMLFTGVGFAIASTFWALLVVAVIGTLNPSGGDVSVFLPTEQSLLSETVDPRDRTGLFARYNLGGQFASAFGSLAAGVPVAIALAVGMRLVDVQRLSFLVYAVVAAALVTIYLGLAVDGVPGAPTRAAPLRRSRGIVIRLSALFCLDSFGGGFVVQSLLVVWLFRRFDLDVTTAGAVFFVGQLFGAASQVAAARLSNRIGLVNTMVFTHLPSNIAYILAALSPTAPIAVFWLLIRMLLGSMDQPARQSYVMSVVPPEERAAAASVTNVPRSLASAGAPLFAGALMNASTFGWTLIVAGVIKSVYDLLLLWQFRAHPPLEEPIPAASRQPAR